MSSSSHSSCSAAQRAQASGLQVHDIDQSDEVHAFLVEAVPAGSLGVLAVTFAILLAVVFQHVVLAGDKEHVLRGRGFQNLVDVVELAGFRQMADVAGVQHELGRNGQRVDLVHGGLQRGGDIGIGRLVEAHVAVADLHKTEVALGCLTGMRRIAEAVGLQHSALQHAERSRAGPGHAFQEAAAVDSVVVVVKQNCVAVLRHREVLPGAELASLFTV